jgi:hypothetical protein
MAVSHEATTSVLTCRNTEYLHIPLTAHVSVNTNSHLRVTVDTKNINAETCNYRTWVVSDSLDYKVAWLKHRYLTLNNY